MSKPRLLITGGTGLLALNWACAMRETWDVVLGTHLHSVELKGSRALTLNLDDVSAFEAQLRAESPDVVVHTAGLASVDACELDPSRAEHDNAELTRNVARACSIRSIKLLHISTDQLFKGDRALYGETEDPSPLNEYARTKLRAEESVSSLCPNALIIRTNFFGWGHYGRRSFSDWIILNLQAGKELTLFDDVYFTPIIADELALAAHQLVEAGASGVFNVVGDERLSKYEFAIRAARHFKLPEALIQKGSLRMAMLAAPRQPDMSLSNSKLRQGLGRNLGNADEHLAALREQHFKGRSAELMRSVKP